MPRVKYYNTQTSDWEYADSLFVVGDGNDSGGDSGGNVDQSGLTTEQITALDGMFKVCAFIKADISAEYNAFKTAFGIGESGDGEVEPDVPDVPDEPDNPEKTLSSISAVYSGGSVPVGTAVTALTGIVVTAHYSDGSTATVTGYALSGTISEGSNTITVSYGGKTATFTVVGIAESGEEAEPLYRFENVDSYEVLDRWNTANTTANITITDGNHVKIFGEGGSASWYLSVNLSSLVTNGKDATALTDTWFTIPANAEVEFTLSNIAYDGTNTANHNVSILPIDGSALATVSLKDLGGATERTTTVTTTADTAIRGVAGSFMKGANEYYEYDVKLYVNGVRWI